MSKITVRPAESADLAPVAAIYADAVHTSVATFDIEEPPPAYWQAKLDSTAVGDHFLVACDENTVLGFAYSGVFRSRPAYGRTREASIYLAPAASGRGLGTRLFCALLDLLRKDQVHLVVSVVAQPNRPAMPFTASSDSLRWGHSTRSASSSGATSAQHGSNCV